MEFDQDNNPFKASLIPNSFGHDNCYLLQLILETHTAIISSSLEGKGIDVSLQMEQNTGRKDMQ